MVIGFLSSVSFCTFCLFNVVRRIIRVKIYEDENTLRYKAKCVRDFCLMACFKVASLFPSGTLSHRELSRLDFFFYVCVYI